MDTTFAAAFNPVSTAEVIPASTDIFSTAAISARIASRIEKLSPKLRAAARSRMGTLSEYDADDIYQHICESITKTCLTKPELLDADDEFFFWLANRRGSSLAGKGRTYTRYVDCELPIAIKGQISHDDRTTNFDFIASDDPNPEDLVIEMEAFAELDKVLTGSNRRLVQMLYQGYSQQEIAAELGICESAVAQRKQTVAKKLAKIMA